MRSVGRWGRGFATALRAITFRRHRRDASERARGIGRMWWWCNYPSEGARLLGAELLIGCLVRRCGRECALARCPRRALARRWWLHLCTPHCHFSCVSGVSRGAVVSGTNQGVPGELTADHPVEKKKYKYSVEKHSWKCVFINMLDKRASLKSCLPVQPAPVRCSPPQAAAHSPPTVPSPQRARPPHRPAGAAPPPRGRAACSGAPG